MGATQQRLLSLDALRGLTIAGMILVNNPGNWGHVYAPLHHAHWNGWTPTDLIFPFFLFIVGASMAFSFAKRREHGASRLTLFRHVVRRSVILFLLGLIMYGFPDFRLIGPYIMAVAGVHLLLSDRPSARGGSRPRRIVGAALLLGAAVYFGADFGHFQATALRVPGVLQRIALCYFFASVIVLIAGVRGAGFAAVVALVPPPAGYTADVTGPEGLLHDWIDVQLLGNHLYGERPDPEGLLSTLPAIATTLLGVLAGAWLRRPMDANAKGVGVFVAANTCLLIGLCLAPVIPINKKIWTSSYVIFTAGMALDVLGMCFWLIDVRGWRRWSWPALVFGSNAIVVYVASSLLAVMLYRWRVLGGVIPVHVWVYDMLLDASPGPRFASLLFAVAYVLFWLAVMTPLYRRRILVKI
jgi:predicted acyltransferase